MAAPRARVYVAALVLSTVLSLARSGAAAPFDLGGHDWEGYADFVEVTRAQVGSALVLAQRLDFCDVRSEDSLILVHPERRLDVESLASFGAGGGGVILLDDFGTGDKLLRHFDIQRVPLPSSPAESLRHNPQLAIAEPVGNNELVRDVTRVVTNHAMGLEHPILTPLLQVRGQDGRVGVLALSGQASRGKLVVIGDPSALMNSMLRYPGNAQLARNVALFVAKAGGNVYLLSGAFDEKGTFVPSPSRDAAHDTGAALALNGARALSGLGPRAAQILAVLIGLSVVVWIGSAAGRTYRVARPRLTRIIPLFTQGGAAGHAAALGARGAPREAALLEIGKSLEEQLTFALGLSRVPSHDVLVGRLVTAGFVDRGTAIALRKLLSRVARIDTLVSAGRPDALPSLGDTDVLAAAKVAAVVREQVLANARGRHAA